MKPQKDFQEHLIRDCEQLQKEYSEIVSRIRELEGRRDWLSNKLRAFSELFGYYELQDESTNTSNQISNYDSKDRFTEMGIRDAILIVLDEHPNGASPIEIANKLKEGGLPTTGATNVEVRVSNELYRMAKSERIKKIGRGQYAPLDLA